MDYEDELSMVIRHVREGKAAVVRQGAIVAKLEKTGHDTWLAESLLAQFVGLQALHQEHLAVLIARGAGSPCIDVGMSPVKGRSPSPRRRIQKRFPASRSDWK